jgi:hypothetical protein
MHANLRDEPARDNKIFTLLVLVPEMLLTLQLHPPHLAKITAHLGIREGAAMNEPKASRPHWPDALQNPSDETTGLKPWKWALERLEKSHNYWIATSRPGGRAHLMLVWGIWWQNAFWFSTGPRTRKAKNISADPHCVIGTEKADATIASTAAMSALCWSLPAAASFASSLK